MKPSTSHSPHVLIHLQIGQLKVRLADVLYDSATLYEQVQVEPNTSADLVLSIDGNESRDAIVLDHGISLHDTVIRFSYQIQKSRQSDRGSSVT